MAGDKPAEAEEAKTAGHVPVPLPDNEFKDQLAQVIPHLRAFGRSLSGSRDLADDLVQETLLKAWAARKRFQAGTNMRAWTFIILRNLFLSQMRRARFKGEWDEITASKLLAAPASQDRHVELGEQFLELCEAAHLAVHRESLAQCVADAGVNGGRGHLHETARRSIDHDFLPRVERIHDW